MPEEQLYVKYAHSLMQLKVILQASKKLEYSI